AVVEIRFQVIRRDLEIRPIGLDAEDRSATSRQHGLRERADMRPDVDDDVVGREAVRQPILVEYDHPVENRLIQRAVAKPAGFAHEAPLATSTLSLPHYWSHPARQRAESPLFRVVWAPRLHRERFSPREPLARHA